MIESLLKRIERNRKEHRRWIALILCLSMVVSLGVFSGLRKDAVAKTYTRVVLECPYMADDAAQVVHTHNDDCYDEVGNLVCTLLELEAHIHGDECYTEVRTLVCGLEENPGHRHTDDCYTAETTLICALEENEGHQHTGDCYTLERGELLCDNTDEEHEHTDACFAWNEVLSCGMEAGEGAHLHSEDCYRTEWILTCGMEEGAGAHTHTDACYLTERVLSCDKPEIVLHTHTDDCYQKNDDGSIYVDEDGYSRLICGQPEIIEHVHDVNCFTVYELDDGEPEEAEEAGDEFVVMQTEEIDGTEADTEAATSVVNDAENTKNTDSTAEAETAEADIEEKDENKETTELNDTEESEEAKDETKEENETTDTETEVPAVAMPAQSFEKTAGGIKVSVEAPKGAFPENTRMSVKPVNGSSFEDQIAKALENEVLEVQAVDITFYDADDNEIEPATAIRVSIVPLQSQHQDQTTQVVHIDREGAAEVVEQAADAVVETDREIVFDADSFSIYAIVYTVETYYRSVTGETFRIRMDFDEQAEIPQNAKLAVHEILEENEAYDYADLLSQAENTLEERKQIRYARFFDISIMADGEEIQPATPVSVKIELTELPEETAEAEAQVLHFGEQMEVLQAEAIGNAVVFETNGFSVYGVIYTVDFHYEANGRMYNFSIPGGGFVSFTDLVEMLGITHGTNSDGNGGEIAVEEDVAEPAADGMPDVTARDAAKKFVADVASVEFSTPSFVDVSRVDADTTVGMIKESRGLAYEYSAELTEEQIAEINAQTVDAGDWALISLQPFDTEETLTVTMTNGDQFAVRVTDAQLRKTVIDAKGDTWEITVTYGEDAQIPDGAELHVQEITEATEHQAFVTKTQETLGRETDDSNARFFDISIMDQNGNEVQPAATVSVEIRLLDTEIVENMQVVHFGEKAELMDLERNPDSLHFSTDGFSVFAVVVVESEEGSYVFRGEGYSIKITHTPEARIPLGTILTVRELDPESDEYIQRLGQAWYEVNREYFEVEEMREHYDEGMGDLPELNLVNLDTARFFDIRFEYNGEEIEPGDAVRVEISYDEGLKALGDCKPVSGVAHFGEEAVELIEAVETKTDENGGIVSFRYEQSGFSDTGTFVGQETYDDQVPQYMAPAPVYDPSKAITLSSLGASNLFGAGEGDGNAVNNASAGSSANLPSPASSKTLTPNRTSDGQKDGTYTLTLSVAGSSRSTNTAEVNRANVLIVMDRSSSMKNNKVKTYTEAEGSYQSGTTYYGKAGDSYFELYYNNGKYYRTVTQQWNGWRWENVYSNEYTGQRYTMTEETRLVAEQGALSALISQLLAKNNEFKQDSQGYLLDDNNQRVLDEDGNPIKVNDIIEISVSSFADQQLSGNTEVDWTTDYNLLMAGINQTNTPSGTNWEDALIYAKQKAEAMHNTQGDEDVYVIFLTDGEPTAVAGESGGAHHYNAVGGGFEFALTEQPSTLKNDTHRDIDGKNALDRAREILSNEWCHFDAVFTYGDRDDQVRYLQRLVNFAYGNADTTNDATLKAAEAVKEHFYDARETSALMDAFQSILSKISGTLSVGNVTVADGLTTDATATTLVNGKADGFRYSVKGPLGELYSVIASGDDSNPTVTFTINGQSIPGIKKTEKVTRNQVDGDGNPVPDPNNPGKYLTVTEDKTYYSATVGTTEYKMALASIESDGQITWDLSAVGTLMEGYSYNCSFVVWPEQEAYDYVAGLNNGLDGYAWDDTAATAVRDENNNVVYYTGGVSKYPSIVKYPNGTFAVLTNTNQSVTYSIVDTKTDETTGETETTYDGPYTKPLEYPDPMELTGSSLSITKNWDDSMDAQQLIDLVEDYKKEHDGETYSITLTMYENGVKYKDFTFKPKWDAAQGCYTWESADFSIAPALLVSKHPGGNKQYKTVTIGGTTYYVLNDGHEYTIDEEVVDYHFEFSADSYHPALVDGVLYNVTFNVDDYGHIVDKSTASLRGDTLETFTGTNTLKGRLYVEKKTEVPEETLGVNLKTATFDVKVTLTDRKGEAISSPKDTNGNYDAESGLMYRIHYGQNNPLAGEYDSSFGNYGRSGKKPVVDGGITETLYADDVIYIGNMPVGTHYVVEETSMPLGWKQVGIVAKNQDGEVDPDQIIYGNKADYVTITNTVPSYDVNILKTCEDGQRPLGGASFKLYGADYYVTDENGDTVLNENPTLIADNLVSDTSTGLIRLGQLGGGEYYLVETAAPEGYLLATGPIRIVVNGASEQTKTYNEEPTTRPLFVTYTQTSNSKSDSGEGVAIMATALTNGDGSQMVDEDGNAVYNYSYTLTVTNNAGYELPSTGGPGTRLFTILGSILILGAGALLWRRRRSI